MAQVSAINDGGGGGTSAVRDKIVSYVTLTNTTAYSKKALDAASVGTIPAGTYIGIEDLGDGWYFVRTIENSLKNFLQSFVTFSNGESAIHIGAGQPLDVKVKKDSVDVYSNPITGTTIGGKVVKSTTFYVVKADSAPDYYYILGTNGSSVYVNNYIKITDTSRTGYSGNYSTYYGATPADDGSSSSSDTEDSSSSGSGGSLDELEPLEDYDNKQYFTYSYQEDVITEVEYERELTDNDNLTIMDVRGILGAPHQWLPTTDPRVTWVESKNDDGEMVVNQSKVFSNEGLGRMYMLKIVKLIPVLFITPGVPNFLTSFSDTQRHDLLSSLVGGLAGAEESSISDLLNGNSGKYYTLKFAYTDYYYYVNAMLRTAALYLGIGNVSINNQRLDTYQWLYNSQNSIISSYNNDFNDYDVNNDMADDPGIDIFGQGGLKALFGPYSGAIPFYADCGNSVSESFSNSTTESQLAGAINGLSDTARELNFLFGNVGANLGGSAGTFVSNILAEDGLLSDALSEVEGVVNKILPSNNIISNILRKGKGIMGGGRLIFPEIWAESTFSRSYNVSMKLITQSGDPLSVYLNILVPLYHVLGLVLPRQAVDGQVYYSPFLVRAYSKGLFNIDMGIITDLSITKGAEGEWTKDGLATIVDVSFGIKDLYDQMSMSKGSNGLLSNIAELDYIGLTCGININDHEYSRMINLWWAMKKGAIKDTIQIGVFGTLSQWVNQKIDNIFGVF